MTSRRFPTKRYIHGCLKEGGVAADAREEFRKETATLCTAELDEFDPFANIEEDEDEFEQNELVLFDC